MIDQATKEQGQAKFEAWAREQLQACGQYAQQSGLITAEATAKAGWALPPKVFLGRVSSKLNPELAYWVIIGPEGLADHVESKVAEDARAAVRHFALRWQLHSAQMDTLQDDGAGEAPAPEQATDSKLALQGQSAEIAKLAEALYAFTQDDGYWVPGAQDPDQA